MLSITVKFVLIVPDDDSKSMPAWLHNHDEEHADIEEFDTDDSVEDDVRTTDESGPAEYSYQPTTIGPLETNHAAIAKCRTWYRCRC